MSMENVRALQDAMAEVCAKYVAEISTLRSDLTASRLRIEELEKALERVREEFPRCLRPCAHESHDLVNAALSSQPRKDPKP